MSEHSYIYSYGFESIEPTYTNTAEYSNTTRSEMIEGFSIGQRITTLSINSFVHTCDSPFGS